MNPIISECHWEITKNCNLACIHCISSTGTKRELNTRNALKVINNLADWGCRELYITGGEPLTRKDIFAILKKAKEKKFKIGLLTNGTLINKRNIKELKLYVDEIGISLDGSSPQVNDQIRGIGTFGKILEAISIVQKAQVPLTLYVTLTKLNLGDFENILKLATGLKIDNIRVNEVSLRGRAFKNRQLLRINTSKRRNLKRYLLKKLEKSFSSNLSKVVSDEYCGVEPTTIFLSSLGHIYSCVEIFQRRPSAHFGNILNSPPEIFEKYKKSTFGLKKERCPYQFVIGSNFTICLNNLSVKCG